MTHQKKIMAVNHNTLKAYDNFKLNINKYHAMRISNYQEENKVKLEKIQDKLYFVSLKRDIKLEKAQRAKKASFDQYAQQLASFKVDWEDMKFDQNKYKHKVSNLKIKYQNGVLLEQKYKQKVHHINQWYEYTKAKVLAHFQKMKKIFKNREQRIITKEDGLKIKSLSNLEVKKSSIFATNTTYIKKLDEQLQAFKSKLDLQKEEIQTKFDNKQMGIHTFNKKITQLDKKFNNRKQVHTNKKHAFVPLVLNAEILKTKTLQIVHENNDRTFLTGTLQEMLKFIANNKIIFITLILLFYTSMLNSNFWQINSLKITMRNNSEVIVMALAMTMVILTGGIDLSVGSVMAFSGVMICYMMNHGTNPILAIFLGIGISTLIGLMQGILIGYGKMVPFVVTLGGLLMFRGLSIIQANSKPIQLSGQAAALMEDIADKEILGINLQIWIVLIAFIIFSLVLKFTVFGRQIYAVGSNRRAAFLSGVKDKRVEMMVYTISGLMAGLAGLLISSRAQSIQPTAGQAWELKAIAATVIGGTALTGGKGGVIGTIAGWIILSMMPTLFITLGYNSQIEQVATGIIIIIAVLFNNDLDFKGGLKSIRNRVTVLFKQYFARGKI